MASTKERAWLAAHQKGSKALVQKLDKAHANNPEYQAFKKKHGLGDTSSVKQVSKSQVDAKKEKARQALAAKAYGATRGTRMGGEDGRGEEIRDTTVPLSPEQHSKVKAAERAAKPVKEKKPKKTAEKKPVDRMALLKQIASKRKINAPPVSTKQLRTIAAVGGQEHDHGGWDDLAGTGFEGRGSRSIDEEVWDNPNPKKTSKALSASQKARAKARARAAGRSYPNLVDNMWASKLSEGMIDDFVASKIQAYHSDKVKGSVEQADKARTDLTAKLAPVKRKIERIKARASYKDKSHARHDETKLDLKHAKAEHDSIAAERTKHYDASKKARTERDANIASDMDTYGKYGLVGLGLKRLKQKLGESYEKAEMHKDKASKALETSDMEAYHMHMANHHEELGKWHESKGRWRWAQKHFDKAEEHHEKGVKMATTLKGSRQMKESVLSKLLGRKPVQKPKSTPAQKSTGYQGLPKEWSQEKRGNEYDANKHMTGVKEEMKVNKDAPFEGPYRKKSAMTTDKSGAKHTGTSRARDLARQALKKMMKEGYMKQTVSDDDAGMSDYEHYMQTKGKKRQVEPPPSAMPSDTRLKPLPKKGKRTTGSFNKFGNYTPGVKEEVEQIDEGNKENKAKKNTYVANIIKKKLSSQVLPSLKFGRRELKKEEAKPDATNAMSDTMKKKHISDKDKATLGKIHALLKAQKKPVKEEVEQIDESMKYGIGSVVKLKKPIDGHEYATVRGITGSSVTRGPTGRGVPMPAGNVTKVKVALRKSDDHSYYNGAITHIKHDDIHSVIRRQ